MAFPATLSLISNVFTERRERARTIGLGGAVAGVAIAMAPIVGGWLLEQFSWASIFTAMAPVAAAAAILVALVVPTSKDPEAAAPDIAGLVLSSATMTLLVFTIIEAPAYGWAAARSLAVPSRLRDGTHLLAVGPVNPGLLPRPGGTAGRAGGCPNLGPGRRIVRKTARSAFAGSSVAPQTALSRDYRLCSARIVSFLIRKR
jgi:MFS family permease